MNFYFDAGDGRKLTAQEAAHLQRIEPHLRSAERLLAADETGRPLVVVPVEELRTLIAEARRAASQTVYNLVSPAEAEMAGLMVWSGSGKE